MEFASFLLMSIMIQKCSLKLPPFLLAAPNSAACAKRLWQIMLYVSKDVMSQLFIGALSPQNGSTTITIGDGLTAYILVCHVGGNTVFEVKEKGRTLYLKNILSTVGLEGWTMSPQTHEAEDATIYAAVSGASVYALLLFYICQI